MKRHLITACFGLSAALATATAFAEDRPQPATNEAGYGYSFDDDLLQARDLDTGAPRIVVVNHSVRATLIRPRTSFVTELFKSVEGL